MRRAKKKNLTKERVSQMEDLMMTRKEADRLGVPPRQQDSRWPQLASQCTWAASAILKTFLASRTSWSTWCSWEARSILTKMDLTPSLPSMADMTMPLPTPRQQYSILSPHAEFFKRVL